MKYSSIVVTLNSCAFKPIKYLRCGWFRLRHVVCKFHFKHFLSREYYYKHSLVGSFAFSEVSVNDLGDGAVDEVLAIEV